MWLWLTDDEAYLRHRVALDPTLISRAPSADTTTRPWMGLHDAGFRQCAGMESLLGEEARLLYDLLGGASTVEASREADAQESLNTLLTVAGVGLGLPALLLTLYGVDGLTPADTPRGAVALAFIALTTATAAVAPRLLAPRYESASQRVVVVSAVVALILLLALAGVVAPD